MPNRFDFNSSTTTLAPHGLSSRASTNELTDSRSGQSTGTSTTTDLTPHPDVTVEALLLMIHQVVCDEIAATGPGCTALPSSSSVTGLSVGPPSPTGTTRTDVLLTGLGTSTGKLCHSTHILHLANPTPVAAHHSSKKPTPGGPSHQSHWHIHLVSPCTVAHLDIQDCLSYTMHSYSHMTHTHTHTPIDKTTMHLHTHTRHTTCIHKD